MQSEEKLKNSMVNRGPNGGGTARDADGGGDGEADGGGEGEADGGVSDGEVDGGGGEGEADGGGDGEPHVAFTALMTCL